MADELRSLVIVLGDQLDLGASAFDGFDAAQDAVWMAEVAEESTLVWSVKPRIAMFLAGMRHFAAALRERGWPLHYTRLDDEVNRGNLVAELAAAIDRLKPQRLVMTAPGEWRLWQAIRQVARAHGLPLDVRDDRHFHIPVRDFADHARRQQAAGRPLRMEFFYREMRQRFKVLMDGDEPRGERWNFDTENRKSFGRHGPPLRPPRRCFEPDAVTREVMDIVNHRFADHPGQLDDFDWPLTRAQALTALEVFITDRLPHFGRWQDAMWPGEPWLYHSQLSAALNLKLLNPREVVAAAVAAHEAGDAPLDSVEGFVRQILGWREYVRGIYWTQMPGYVDLNALDHHADLPAFYWTGNTEMACLRDALRQTLSLGYAHHIQRLMITGAFALMFGVQPQQVHAWYLAVYVDAVEWVELPNTLGMSQFGDGGLMASKPYIGSGRYIERMASGAHCARCRFRPGERTGDDACPFTTLYWDFLQRHRAALASNTRMAGPLKALAAVPQNELAAVHDRAEAIRRGDVG